MQHKPIRPFLFLSASANITANSLQMTRINIIKDHFVTIALFASAVPNCVFVVCKTSFLIESSSILPCVGKAYTVDLKMCCLIYVLLASSEAGHRANIGHVNYVLSRSVVMQARVNSHLTPAPMLTVSILYFLISPGVFVKTCQSLPVCPRN